MTKITNVKNPDTKYTDSCLQYAHIDFCI